MGSDYIKYMTGHTLGTCCSTEMKGMEFLRDIGPASGLSIRPKAQASKVEVLKKTVRAYGLNPEEVDERRFEPPVCNLYSANQKLKPDVRRSDEEVTAKCKKISYGDTERHPEALSTDKQQLSFKGLGELGNVTRLRGWLSTVDPWNLTQIMLAEGEWRKQNPFKKRLPSDCLPSGAQNRYRKRRER